MNSKKPVTRKSCCWELTATEKETVREIFKAILESGRAPTVEELKKRLQRPAEEIIRILDGLEAKDLLLRRKGTQQIISIYPVSLKPTQHQVVLEHGTKLSAMCALDALGIPALFDKNADVVSECELCKKNITIKIKDGEIAAKSHPDIQIWNTREIIIPAAKTCCPLVNFFCTKEHLKDWENKNPDLSNKGEKIVMEQAFPENRDRWKRYAQMIGIR